MNIFFIFFSIVVTGATDGIGKSYAKQLAKQGLNIILVSRTQAKLESVAAEIGKHFKLKKTCLNEKFVNKIFKISLLTIEKEYKVQTKMIAVDFSSGPEIYEKIAKEIKGIGIGILVNNVGVSYAHPEYFLDVPNRDQTFDQIFSCNMVSVVNMTKIVLPIMIGNQKGIILNIASMSGTISQPLLTVYSASKVNEKRIAIFLFVQTFFSQNDFKSPIFQVIF